MDFYARLMESWERRLTLKDPHRQIFPFEWGLEWIPANGFGPGAPADLLKRWSKEAVIDSEGLFAPPELRGVELKGDELTFEAPLLSRFQDPENSRAKFRLFRGSKEKAVVVIPQWNADPESHVGLCKILKRLGLTAVRAVLPYHEHRKPGEMARADLMVSPNIGRTLHATRQAVLEIRQVVDWLCQEGYRHIAILGTSLGSCVGYLTFTHEQRLEVGVFNHVSAHYADVVWTGLSTRYVKWGLEGQVSLEDLRKIWAPLSPLNFVERLQGDARPHLFITAQHDLTFLPELAEKVFEKYSEQGIPFNRAQLPCGHYTTAHFPFKYLDAWHICRFLHRHLGK